MDATESIPGVVDLKMDEKYGCELNALTHWEQLYSVNLPEEVKNFYLATNGFELTWKFRLAGVYFGSLPHVCIFNLIYIFHKF